MTLLFRARSMLFPATVREVGRTRGKNGELKHFCGELVAGVIIHSRAINNLREGTRK